MARLLVWRLPWVTLGVAALLATSYVVGVFTPHWARPVAGEEAELATALEAIFAQRANTLVRGGSKVSARYYDRTQTSGAFAYEHETRRASYVHAWLRERHVAVTRLDPSLRIIAMGVDGDKAWASVCQHLILHYRHDSDPPEYANVMGTRTIHWVELSRRDGAWVIQRDWFWDPFKDDTLFTEVTPLRLRAPYSQQANGAVDSSGPAGGQVRAGRFNRAAALAYADRYCGVRIGDSTGRYNQEYRDFTGIGGDCANFASQVLSDRDGGGMPTDWAWYSSGNTGSAAWLRADSLVYYLLDTGRAALVARGGFSEVAEPSASHPQGAVYSLEPGDIIGYEKKGGIAHVSVVVGKDSAGYPVVDSHSGDRYHVPWDLGFDSRTRYWLLHITY